MSSELSLEMEKEEMVLDFSRAAKRSTYTTVAGLPTDLFYDVDDFLLGQVEEGIFENEIGRGRREVFLKAVCSDLLRIASRFSIVRLAFVEKGGPGPVGMLAWLPLLLNGTGMEACVVRPRKRLLLSSTKGRPVQKGERFLIVSDVATTGMTIMRAAARLRALGGVVPAAYVLYDRQVVAREWLEKEDMELFCLLDKDLKIKAENNLLSL